MASEIGLIQQIRDDWRGGADAGDDAADGYSKIAALRRLRELAGGTAAETDTAAGNSEIAVLGEIIAALGGSVGSAGSSRLALWQVVRDTLRGGADAEDDAADGSSLIAALERVLTIGYGRSALFRDWFQTAAAPVVDGSAEPGVGIREITGSRWTIYSGERALRGGGQTGTPAWGASAYAGEQDDGSGFARTAGRTVVALFIPEDTIATGQAFAIGWGTAAAAADPRTDGHALVSELGTLAAAAAGQKVVTGQTRTIRPAQYLIGVTLLDAGAIVWVSAVAADPGLALGSVDPIGIPAYPSARIVWAGYTGTTTPLYPIAQMLGTLSYPRGNQLQDMRMLDLPAIAALETAIDLFTRGDSASSLGGSWATDAGTFGISSNKAYPPSLSGISRAYLANAMPSGDGLIVVDITIPSNIAAGVGILLRRQDASNYIRCWTNGTNQIQISAIVAGSFSAIASTAVTWTTGRTYRWYLWVKGARYFFLYEDLTTGTIADPFGGAWQTDSGNRFLTATGVGLFALNGTGYTSIRWDNLRVLPLTFTLSGVTGALPAQLTAGASLASDSFTDTNGTRLNAHTAAAGGAWTEHAGTWTIDASGRAACSTVSGSNFATQDLGVTAAGASVTVRTPSSFATGKLRAGIAARYTDSDDFIVARIYMDDATQLNNDEVELIEGDGAGSSAIVHKVNIGNYFATSTGYALTMEIAPDPNRGAAICHVSLAGTLILSYPLSQPATGTRWGLYRDSADDGCTFDDWSASAR